MNDDKALDEHVERAKDISDWSENGPAVWVIADLLGDITALRARVKELEARLRAEIDTADNLAMGYSEARQVTREQSEKFVGLLQQYMDTADAHDCAYAALSELRFEILDDAGFVGSEPSKSNDTKIVEEAPKAERRECECPECPSANPKTFYWCKKRGDAESPYVATRCTEGERDETR